MNRIIALLCVALTFLSAVSCRKFLDAKPDKSLVTPSTLTDLSAILDGGTFYSEAFPGFGQESCDDYYLSYATWSTLSSPSKKNYYTWTADDQYSGNWSGCYSIIFTSNVILEEVEKLSRDLNRQEWDRIKGSSLFYRGLALYELAQTFCMQYQPQLAAGTPGLPLRLSSDFNPVSTRSTLQQTYEQMISDVAYSIPLLPVTPLYKTRASKPAAFATLARIYLSMMDYHQAGRYADSALFYENTLIDYNTLDASSNTPLQQYNPEVILHATIGLGGVLSGSRAKVDTVLYQMYDSNDLRKTVFFRRNSDGSYRFKGSYDGYGGAVAIFGGPTVDEMLLIRAESFARDNKPTEAMSDLNRLLEKRYKTNTFTNLTASTADEALALVLRERRKELCFRGRRWPDLRRLNIEPAHATTLYRELNGEIFTLEPGSTAYTCLIPLNVIRQSNVEQNVR